MCLAGLVGDVGGKHEVIEHGIHCLGQYHRHIDGELSLVVGHGLAFGHQLVVLASADIASFPVARVTHPPEGACALNLISYRSSLYGYTGIRAGRTTGYHGVAVLVVLCHAGNIYLKSRPLVFLHLEAVSLVIGKDIEVARQARCGQGELGSAGTEVVGSETLLTHYRIIDIAQFHQHLLATDGLVVTSVIRVIDDGRSMHRLSRAIDGTVGKDADVGFLGFYAGVITKTVPAVHEGTSLVVRRIGPHQEAAQLLGIIEQAFALFVGSQRRCVLVASVPWT